MTGWALLRLMSRSSLNLISVESTSSVAPSKKHSIKQYTSPSRAPPFSDARNKTSEVNEFWISSLRPWFVRAACHDRHTCIIAPRLKWDGHTVRLTTGWTDKGPARGGGVSVKKLLSPRTQTWVSYTVVCKTAWFNAYPSSGLHPSPHNVWWTWTPACQANRHYDSWWRAAHVESRWRSDRLLWFGALVGPTGPRLDH